MYQQRDFYRCITALAGPCDTATPVHSSVGSRHSNTIHYLSSLEIIGI